MKKDKNKRIKKPSRDAQLIMGELKKIVTKKEIKEFTSKLESAVLSSIKDYALAIKGYYKTLSQRMNRLDTTTSKNYLEIVKQQKYLLQKIKEHERKIEKLESEMWQN